MTSRQTSAKRGKGLKRPRGKREIRPLLQSHAAGSIGRPLAAFADETFTVLKYCQQVTFNPGATLSSNNTFSMNGCYDPDITGTGHQPYGFDEYCAAAAAGPYNRYTVLRTRFSAKVFVPQLDGATPGTAEPRGGAIVVVNARRENTANWTNPVNGVEDPSCQAWALVNQFQNCQTIRTPWIDVGKYFGLKPAVYGSQVDFSGTYAANPANQAYWIITVGTTAQTVNDPIDIYATVLIEYEVRFWSQNASVASVSVSEMAADIKRLTEEVAALTAAAPPSKSRGTPALPKRLVQM